MNKLIITVISALFLSATGMAMAQDTGEAAGKKNHRHQRGNQAMPAVEKLSRALRKLDLSDEQKTSIHAIFKQVRADIRPLVKETKAERKQLKVLTMASEYDAPTIAAIAQKEGDLLAQRRMLTSKAFADALGYLTEEQRTQLDTMIAEREQRAKKHKQRGKGI
jgi:Spy/CpxP family protein refolding chaperone